MINETVAGIDLSLNCPAICVIEGYDDDILCVPYERCHFYYLTNDVNRVHNDTRIHGELMGDWSNDQERYETIAEWALAILKRHDVKHIGIEGYAYGANTSCLTKLAENCGLLKYILHTNGITFDVYPPSNIKKLVTGNGNASKAQMYGGWFNDTGVDLPPLFYKGKIPSIKCISKSPISDIVDAYYIATVQRAEVELMNRDFYDLDTGKETE